MRTIWVLVTLLLLAGGCAENSAAGAAGGLSGDSERDAPGQPADPADLDRASVRGFAYSTGIVDDPANALPGAVPRAGEALEVRNLFGQLLATTVTGADGYFEVTGLEPGLLLFVELTGPDLRVPFTAFAGADVTLGRAYRVSRADAAVLVLANVPAEALVAAPLQPLPAGTLVSPRGVDPATGSEATVLATDAWFFYVDLEPWLRFSHSTVFHFVDASTGAVETVDVMERPRINLGAIWSDDFELFRYLLDAQGNQISEPGEEVVQVPLAVPPIILTPLPLALAQNGTNDRVFVLILQGDNGTAQRADAKNVRDWALGQDVPVGNIVTVRFPQGRAAKPGDTDYDFDLGTIKNQIEQEIDDATLIVYLTAHGPEEDDTGMGTGEALLEFSDGKERYWKPKRFGLTETGAAKVRVILDMCYARKFGNLLAAEFNEVPENSRPDLQIFCSSQANERSIAIPLFVGMFTPATTGGRFTNAILPHARLFDNELLGLLDASGQNLRPGFGLVGHEPNVIVQPAPH